MRRHILVTGASGFVGSALIAAAPGRHLRRALRQPALQALPGDAIVGDIGQATDWKTALEGVDCVVHLAARTHMHGKEDTETLAMYRNVNVEGTRRLARQAADSGVRRFVFLSSIKVNGEATLENPFKETDPPAPQDAYGITKRDAENALRAICADSKMEWVILRPPLVYGPGVKGNFLRLMQLIHRGLPLPLASIENRRSLIHVANLADALITCIDAPAAAGHTWLASDSGEISTPELIRKLAAAMDRPARLLPCPVTLLKLGAALCGQPEAVARLTGSLVVDASSLRNTLGWHPRILLDQGLIDTARWYHRTQIKRRR